jgi:hypothetical protein
MHKKAFEHVFKMGFLASSQGFNGEHPFNYDEEQLEQDAHFISTMEYAWHNWGVQE